jgi:hypothetical protein
VRRLVCERPGHSATSAHLCAAYPFIADGGPGRRGVYIGRDAYGGAFAYDPWLLYPDVLQGPNMLVLGAIGSRKSSLVKTYIYRQILHGRQAWVLDPKGEFWPLAAALGVPVLSLWPGGDLRLNPVTRRGSFEGQLGLLRAVAGAALRRELDPEEDAGLRVALEQVNEECGAAREPTLPDVVEALLHPREPMVQKVSAASGEDLAAACRQVALGLQRLCAGDLRGMFDGPTSAGIDLDAPLVVIDLSRVRDSSALGILMACAGAWRRANLEDRKRAAEEEGIATPQMISVGEEGWRLTSHIGAAEWLLEDWKLCRALGIQNVFVIHRLTDLGASGEEGSREARIADGLIADADTTVIHRQSPDQRDVLRGRLGRSSSEIELVMGARPGEALWVVGRRSFLVRHRISQIERPLVFTDWRMGGAPTPA